MKRTLVLVLMGLTAVARAQPSPLNELDSLLLLSFPHDTLQFEGEMWVEHLGQTGRFLWNDSSWAWNADTSQSHHWRVRLAPNAPLLVLDLRSMHGTLNFIQPSSSPSERWERRAEESTRFAMRVRVFSDGGNKLVVASASDLPRSELLSDWHRQLAPGWRSLAPLPRQVTPLEFQASDGTGWSVQSVNHEEHCLVTEGLRVFDPNRTLMEVVREQKTQR
jgi:hypothetical protein